MRYDKKIILVKRGPATYNTATGDYDEAANIEKPVMASVVDTSAEKMMQIYGKIMQGSYTVQLQGKHEADSIIVDNKPYHIDRTRYLRNKTVYTVTEGG